MRLLWPPDEYTWRSNRPGHGRHQCRDDNEETDASIYGDEDDDEDKNLDESESDEGESSSESDTSQDSDMSTSSMMDDDILALKEQLQNQIDDVDEPLCWVAACSLSNTVNPGLTLNEEGIIGFPLSAHDASRIKGYALTETQIYDYIHDTGCELSSDHFELRNPAWKQHIQAITSRVASAIGINVAEAKLEKLVLHGVDSDLPLDLQPRDTNDHVGTMVVCLPSLHDGGEIQLSHAKKTERFSTSIASEFNHSYICWFSDVQTSVSPISSGFRLQLVYSLHQIGSEAKLSASRVSEKIREFKGTLTEWKALYCKTGKPRLLTYVFQESKEYGNATPQYKTLEEGDKCKAQFLKQCCRKKDFCLFLASMSCSIEPSGEKTIGLSEVADLDGNVVATDVTLKETDLIQTDVFDNRDSNDSEYDDDDDYLYRNGNRWYNEDITQNFRDWVALLMPESYRLKFLVDSKDEPDINAWIAELLKELSSQAEDHAENNNVKGRKLELLHLCQTVMRKLNPSTQKKQTSSSQYYTTNPSYTGPLENIVRSALLLDKRRLFNSALSIEPSRLCLKLFHDIGKMMNIATFGWYEKGLDQALIQIASISDRDEILQSLWSGYQCQAQADTENGILGTWIKTKTLEALGNVKVARERDSQALLAFGQRYGMKMFTEDVLPFATAHGSNLEFAFNFMKTLSEARLAKTIDNETVATSLQSILSSFIPSFSLNTSENSAKRQKTAFSQASHHGTPLTGASVAKIIDDCAALELNNEIHMLLSQVTQATVRVDAETLENLLMPFLQELNLVMQKHKIEHATYHYQLVFQSVIEKYLLNFVHYEPPAPPTDWGFPGRFVGAFPGTCCRCADCGMLDPFLNSPTREIMEFRSTGARRDHLESTAKYVRGISTRTQKNPHAPHSLMLQKTLEPWKFDIRAWESRCMHATGIFNNIGLEALRQLLGNRYDELIEMRLIKRAKPGAVSLPPHIIDLEA